MAILEWTLKTPQRGQLPCSQVCFSKNFSILSKFQNHSHKIIYNIPYYLLNAHRVYRDMTSLIPNTGLFPLWSARGLSILFISKKKISFWLYWFSLLLFCLFQFMLWSLLFPFSYLSFTLLLLVCINCTNHGFHCDIFIHSHTLLDLHSPHLLLSHLPPPLFPSSSLTVLSLSWFFSKFPIWEKT
jgi:hypothetical protein